MLFLRNIISLKILLVLISTMAHGQTVNQVTLQLSSDSQLAIRGKANIANFECSFVSGHVHDTIQTKVSIVADVVHLSNAGIEFPVKHFDCGNKVINKDFRKTLDHENHPTITLDLTKIYFDGSGSGDNYLEAEAEIIITIAGRSNTYLVPFDEITFGQGNIAFTGRQQLAFSYFDLEAPTAVFGMVKVRDELDVSFDFNLLLIKKGPEGPS